MLIQTPRQRLRNFLVMVTLGLTSFAGHAQFLSQSDTSFNPKGLEQMSIAGSNCTGFFGTPSFQCVAAD